jgi:sugar/nucleoside kinase (ribokinase family)
VLCVVGDLVEDVVVRLAGPPARGTDTPAVVVRTRGGSAANVAAAAATAGYPTRFVGRVGADATGDLLVASLAASGTGVDVRVQRGGRTGTVVVLVEPDGERTMLPDRAAAQQLAPVDPAWLTGVTWLHLPAYSLCAEPIGASTLGVVERVRRAGTRLSVDVSSVAVVEAFGVTRFAALIDELAPDVVFANVAEAALVQGVEAALLVVKDGARPVELRHLGGRVDQVAVPLVAGVVDTTGAGDAFAGGYLAAVGRGVDPVAAAGEGAALAARTLTAAGAQLDAGSE